MKLQEAYNFLQNLKNETNKKSEIKIYEKFLHILNALKNRKFSTDEMLSLETELENINLKSDHVHKIKQLKKTLSRFEKYLKDTFSLISRGYYTNLGVGLGSSYGLLFGIIFLSRFERSLGISLGVAIGMLIGITIGKNLDATAASKGQVL